MVQIDGVDAVDITRPAGFAEGGGLVSLLNAACRPCMHLAPGMLVTAPDVTGAGEGKGLLVRSIAAIAFGVQPAAFTAGHDRAELDKRLVAELVAANHHPSHYRPLVWLSARPLPISRPSSPGRSRYSRMVR
jgi:hypothetical protein